jgi:hypothetical protein
VVLKVPVDEATLLAHCRDRLASYKVPRRLWVRSDDTLPTKGSARSRPRARNGGGAPHKPETAVAQGRRGAPE